MVVFESTSVCFLRRNFVTFLTDFLTKNFFNSSGVKKFFLSLSLSLSLSLVELTLFRVLRPPPCESALSRRLTSHRARERQNTRRRLFCFSRKIRLILGFRRVRRTRRLRRGDEDDEDDFSVCRFRLCRFPPPFPPR